MNIGFLLSINIHEVQKTYHFDSKNAKSIDVQFPRVQIGEINSTTVNPSEAGEGTQIQAEFEFEKDNLIVALIKVDQQLNLWEATVIIRDKALSDDDENNYYELGTFEVSLDNTNL
ncbi:MAG: hypothetical protein KDD37_06945 [Bdellovibrionales bacterium]|nr:hypothetical protein [Bdellovibrionales bacterium]